MGVVRHVYDIVKMPSDAAKRRQQQKKESKKLALEKKKTGHKDKVKSSTEEGTSLEPISSVEPPKPGGASPRIEPLKLSHRSCTGVLVSHPLSRDVHIERLSLTFHGAELLCDTKLELNCGRRYGLLGLNGSGKYYL